jgi:hypothetical protein
MRGQQSLFDDMGLGKRAVGQDFDLRAHQNWPSSNPDYYTGTLLATHHVNSNQPPAVSITSPPADMYVGLTGSNVALASTTSSGVQRVEYYANNVYIGVGYSSPSFQVNWVPSASGQFSLTAKAYDALNTSGVSATRTVIVAQPGMPAIAATNGTADQYFPMGTTWKRQKRRARLTSPMRRVFCIHSFNQWVQIRGDFIGHLTLRVLNLT